MKPRQPEHLKKVKIFPILGYVIPILGNSNSNERHFKRLGVCPIWAGQKH